MKAIHLIQNDPTLTPWPKAKGSKEYESGYWDISPDRARKLIGAEIYFHEKQKAPSFFGGRITSFSIKPDEPWSGRIIFFFDAGIEFKGKETDSDNWAMWVKFVD